jgi:Protein of unknown function (DUF3592)
MLSQHALFWTTVGAALCALFAAGLLHSLIKAWRRIAASRAWPVASGQIVVSAVDVPQTHDSDDATDCTARIRYRYRVAGKDYESDSVTPGGGAMLRRQFAEELVARYPVGAHVDVTYDPQAPERAVLEPTNADNLVPQVVFMVVFAAIATVLAVHAIAGKVVTTAGGFPLFGFLLPVAAILVGGFCIAGFTVVRRQARVSTAWPTASGKITAAAVASETLRVGEESRDSRPRFETRYRPVINYVYRVDGHDYYGSGIAGSGTLLHATPTAAQAVVDAYPVGRDVAVYYDPARPRTAVLARGNASGTTVPLVAGVVFSLGGALMLWAFSGI